jgi:FLVCR family feline leukemia virus subgroup C receptor-related protein
LQGLRVAAICGVLGTCVGAWIKVFSVQPDLFWLGFIGQALVAASQCFILSLPAKVAAVWFGPDQVSSACSIGVFGNQVNIICHVVFVVIARARGRLLFHRRKLVMVFSFFVFFYNE